MSAARDDRGPDIALAKLLQLADDLGDAIATGDVGRAREAHGAIGEGLKTAAEHGAAVIDLRCAQEKRSARRRSGR